MVLVESISSRTGLATDVSLTGTGVVASSDDVVVILTSEANGAAASGVTVTFNGKLLVQEPGANSKSLTLNGHTQFWYVRNPPVGPYTIVVATPDGPSSWGYFAYTLSGVNKAQLHPKFQIAGPAAVNPFTAVLQNSSSNSLIIEALSSQQEGGIFPIGDHQVQSGAADDGSSSSAIGSAIIYSTRTNELIGWKNVPNATMSVAYMAVFMEADFMPSIWNPVESFKDRYGLIKGNNLNSGTSRSTVKVEVPPPTPYLSLFLHTVGRYASKTAGAASLATLTDNFAGSIDATKWSSFATGTASIAQSGGVVTATPPALTIGSDYAGYDSVNSYTLIGSYGLINISTMVSVSTNAQCYFKLFVDGGNYIQWLQQNGTLFAQKVVAGSTTTVASVAYNATNHAWLRIRESGGTTFWDTSLDGSSWTNFTSTANPITLTSLTVEFAAGTFQSEITPGAAIFDNFNVLVSSIAQAAATLTATGGTQAIAAAVATSIAQAAATLTAIGGTQIISSTQIAAIAQSAATVTATGGTQTVSAIAVVSTSITQVGATLTVTGGTQTIAAVQKVTIAQAAATLTVTGGTQTVATVQNAAIAQVAATLTASGGTQVVTAGHVAAIAQSAATLTISGGTQVISTATIISASITQSAATLTVHTGLQQLANFFPPSPIFVTLDGEPLIAEINAQPMATSLRAEPLALGLASSALSVTISSSNPRVSLEGKPMAVTLTQTQK